ncbi:MAG: response regulator transcription factor [Clostridiales bacterium]|nr:response regulator transcription factor [Clostridiales bacterium]MBQ2156353.1 response regulator transcription factor [Clostridiales bacterium]MBQ5518620.1 response regulator transcription factor [Clostridiales bacterium]
MNYKVLIADDEKEIRNLLRLYLENDGFTVTDVASGEEVAGAMDSFKPDIVLLDVMMPGKDGIHVLKDIREVSNVPVMIISARTADAERILGLNVGADDYICKPFNPLEVVARVKSNLRRFYSLGSGEGRAEKLTIGDLELDTEKCLLLKAGKAMELTSVEYKIMELLMKHPGKVFTKQQIYEYAWGEDYFVADNNIMVAISKLRTKLDEDPSRYIKTLRGLGYRLDA